MTAISFAQFTDTLEPLLSMEEVMTFLHDEPDERPQAQKATRNHAALAVVAETSSDSEEESQEASIYSEEERPLPQKAPRIAQKAPRIQPAKVAIVESSSDSEEASIDSEEEKRSLTFANNLKVFREQMGWSQQQLAEEIGDYQNQISNLETCSPLRRTSTAMRVAKIFDVRLSYLYARKFSSVELKNLFNKALEKRQVAVNGAARLITADKLLQESHLTRHELAIIVSKNLRALRELNDLTKRSLAFKARCSIDLIKAHEKKEELSSDFIDKITSYFKIKAVDFLSPIYKAVIKAQISEKIGNHQDAKNLLLHAKAKQIAKDNICWLRTQSKLSSTQFAKQAGISRDALRRYELGLTYNHKAFMQIAERFKHNPQQFFTDKLQSNEPAVVEPDIDTADLKGIIGKNIRLLQKTQGWTNLQAAKETKLAKSTYINYKNAKNFNVQVATQIAIAYGITYKELCSADYAEALQKKVDLQAKEVPDMDKVKARVSANIRYLQAKKGCNDPAVYLGCGISRSTYQNHKFGKTFSKDAGLKIATFFNLSLEKMISDSFEQATSAEPDEKDSDRNEALLLGKKIANLQKLQGLTDREMAEKLGIPKTTYQGYKLGKIKDPSSHIIEKITRFHTEQLKEIQARTQ